MLLWKIATALQLSKGYEKEKEISAQHTVAAEFHQIRQEEYRAGLHTGSVCSKTHLATEWQIPFSTCRFPF